MGVQEERRGPYFLQDVTLGTDLTLREDLTFALDQKMGQIFKGLRALGE